MGHRSTLRQGLCLPEGVEESKEFPFFQSESRNSKNMSQLGPLGAFP